MKEVASLAQGSPASACVHEKRPAVSKDVRTVVINRWKARVRGQML